MPAEISWTLVPVAPFVVVVVLCVMWASAFDVRSEALGYDNVRAGIRRGFDLTLLGSLTNGR